MGNLNKTKLAIAIGSAMSLAGCLGGGSSSGGSPGPASSSYSVSGVATNGLLQSAKVCVDLNSNLKCDTNEPTATTNSQGEYSIEAEATEIQGKYIVVEVKSDTVGNSTGKSNVLLSKLPESISGDIEDQTISPFTTLYDAASDSDKAKLLENLGFESEAQLRAADYQSNQARNAIAEKLAQRIADDLQAGVVSSSITPDQILLSDSGLKAVVQAIADESTPITSDSLDTILASVEAQAPELTEVNDVKLNVAIKTDGGANVNGASITVKAYQAGTKTLIEGTNGSNTMAQVIGETSEGRAQLDLPKYAQSAVDLQVRVEKAGFVTLEKVLKNVKTGDRLPINFTLTTEALETYAVSDSELDLGSATAASIKSGKPALTFALVRMQNGEEVLLGGQAAAQAMNDGASDVQVGVQIPLDRVNENVKAITAGIKGFDPSRSQDSQSFPGNFEGVGLASDFTGVGINTEARSVTGANDAQDEVVPIISTSFAQIRLEDQDGNSFELAPASEAQSAADGDNPTIYLRVPSSTYNTITHDAGSELSSDPSGVQVPIYVYRSGQGWVMIGLATLVYYDSSSSTYLNYSGGVNPVTFDGQLFAEIEITEGNEWVQWVNIDWPIVAGDVVEHTFKGQVRYEGEQAEPYNGYGYVEFEDGSQEWIYATNGRFSFTRPTTSANAATATAYLFNENTYDYESFEFATSDEDSNTQILDPNPARLTNPYRCQVQGQLVKNDEPVTWRGIELYSDNGAFWRYVYSDFNGNFSSVAPCNEEVNLFVSGQSLKFTVDDTTTTGESSDDGTQVVLSEIVLPNQAPMVWGYGPNRLIVPETGTVQLDLSAYGYDVDSSDLTFEWTCPSSASSAYVFNSANHRCAIDVSHLGGQDTATLNWSVKVTDSEGASSTYTGAVQAEKANINRAPKIWRIERGNADGTGLVSLSCSNEPMSDMPGMTQLVCRDRLLSGSTVSYKLVATDSDGDGLSYGRSDSLDSNNENLFTNIPVKEDLTFSVSDQRDVWGNLESKTAYAKVITEIIENQAPSVYVGLNRYNLVKGTDSTLKIFTYTWDDFTETEDLTIDFRLINNNTGSGQFIIPEGGMSTWELDVSGFDSASYRLDVIVRDDASPQGETTQSVNFTIGNSLAPEVYDMKLSVSSLELGYSVAPTFLAQVWDERVDDLSVTVDLYRAGELVQSLTPSFEGYRLSADLPLALQAGAYEVRLTVQDSDNEPVTQSYGFNVEDPAATGGETTITVQ